jgi:beta-glucosidase
LGAALEGVDPAAFKGYATLVQSPGEADVAVIRLQAPSYHDPAKGFLGAMHMGSLDFRDVVLERIAARASATPTVFDVYLERPAVLTRLSGTAALLGSFGTDDTPFVELLFGDAQPEGRLPFDLPRSMETVTASRTDVAFDTESPLFRFGHGLRYAAQSV